MIYGAENIITIILLVISIIIVSVAQYKINSAYSKYKRIELEKGLTGFEVARMILDANGLNDIYIVETKGQLTDHYDPNRKTVRLSTAIFHGSSIASASVAAHECGHAIQDKDGYFFLRFRSVIFPIVKLITYLGYIGIIISIFAGITSYLKVSLLIIFVMLLFQLVTLPVEFDASNRAIIQLKQLNIVNDKEITQSKTVLNAAAMTYIASFVSNLISLLRIVIMLNDRD